ncbi:Nicotinate-nucleotide pyrophosphorylase [carboxylating], chloroplastic [Glycine soja]
MGSHLCFKVLFFFFRVETRTLEEVEEVLHYSSQTKTSLTRIMLDNMVVPLPNGDLDISMLKEVVQLINGRYETEKLTRLLSCLIISRGRWQFAQRYVKSKIMGVKYMVLFGLVSICFMASTDPSSEPASAMMSTNVPRTNTFLCVVTVGPIWQLVHHPLVATPHRSLFWREKFTHMIRDASLASVTLEPHPFASGRALFMGEQYLSPLRAFVGCSRGFSAQPHEWNHLYFCLCGVYNICNKLSSYDIYAPA